MIDLGPEGGERGGRIVAQGTPEQICENPQSLTGRYLRPVLEQPAAVTAGTAATAGAAASADTCEQP